MAFTHLAKHIVLANQYVAGVYDELDDAISAAEALAAGEGEPPRAFIIPVTEVIEVA